MRMLLLHDPPAESTTATPQFITWRALFLGQQELLGQQRRIEAADTNLGIGVGAGSAFIIYLLTEISAACKPEKPPVRADCGWDIASAGLVAASVLIAIIAITFLSGTGSVKLVAFLDSAARSEIETVRLTLQGMRISERANATTERWKVYAQRGVLLLAFLAAVAFLGGRVLELLSK